ncbi:hypothetical protein [Actinomadura alba]|uniref:PPE family protein n=1 Tax=Actinomadura alba TaxID=406431 RepID=A0ABR7LNA6_9ACTN|nr:hypothetical protein [Actinomadura alba]MBC6466342.1 hypothetical protein [Actinomadura alba]
MTRENRDIRSEDINTDGSGIGGWNSLKVWENQYDALKQIINGMQPEPVQKAGAAYTAVSKRMEDTVELIYDQSRRLAEHWGGKDAVAAMTQMQKAYEQAKEIYTESQRTGNALTSHSQMQQSWKDNVRDDPWWSSDWMALGGATGLGARNQQAGELMERLQSQTAQSNSNFPASIQADMPNTNISPYGPGERPPGGPGKPPGGPGGGDLPKGPGGGDLPKGPGGGDFPKGPGGGDFPKGPGGGDLPNGPGGGDLPNGPGGGGYPGGGGSDLAGVGGGAGGGGLSGGMPGGGGLGPGGVGGGLGAGGGLPGGGVGAGGAGPGAFGGPGMGALGKNGLGAGGMGMGGMPMGAGGGQGGDGEERERTTWLTEDEDVWGADDDAAPPVIG